MYRMKTVDEFLAEGYVLTPAGNLLHAEKETVRPEMLSYGETLSQSVLKIVAENNYSTSVDSYVFCPEQVLFENNNQG